MLSGYENGRKQPTLPTLEKILLAMGCSLRDLVGALELVRDGKLSARAGSSLSGEESFAGSHQPASGGYVEKIENLQPRPLPPTRSSGPAGASWASRAPQRGFDLGVIFGAEPLAHEEEEAFGEMLSGYCRWLRFLRRQAASACSAEKCPPGEPFE